MEVLRRDGSIGGSCHKYRGDGAIRIIEGLFFLTIDRTDNQMLVTLLTGNKLGMSDIAEAMGLSMVATNVESKTSGSRGYRQLGYYIAETLLCST